MWKWIWTLLVTANFFVSNGQNKLVLCNQKLIAVVMEDIFSPPLASRVHVYPNLAAYEVARYANNLPSIYDQLNNIPGQLPQLKNEKIDYELGAVHAFCRLAKELVYSEYMIDDFWKQEEKQWWSVHSDSSLYTNTINFSNAIANKISEYLKGDNYGYTRTLMRYVVVDTPGSWQPTAPDYMNALEPNWYLMRSFIFDSNNAIQVKPNIVYSEKKNSAYYKQAKKLHKVTGKLDSIKKHIALYWDDNANILKSGGHLSYFEHKITPLGHWLSIAGQAIQHHGMNTSQAARIYALTSIAQYEAVLSCWTEKYRSNAMRPETYINKLIDAKWKSLIETPPFPEYTSGHSCISGASATILTQTIPQPYSFTDSTELLFNLGTRTFPSFQAAASEASISRYYGGIHYMPALNEGLNQGKKIAQAILTKLK